eukprot:6471440-Amphidinium_carterae.2
MHRNLLRLHPWRWPQTYRAKQMCTSTRPLPFLTTGRNGIVPIGCPTVDILRQFDEEHRLAIKANDDETQEHQLTAELLHRIDTDQTLHMFDPIY